MSFNIFFGQNANVKKKLKSKQGYRFVIFKKKYLTFNMRFHGKNCYFRKKIIFKFKKIAYLYLEGFGVALALDDPVEDTYVDGFS